MDYTKLEGINPFCTELWATPNRRMRWPDLLHFDVQGPGCIIGVDNGDSISHESFQAPRRHAFNGFCLAMVQATQPSGHICFQASADGLVGASLDIQVV